MKCLKRFVIAFGITLLMMFGLCFFVWAIYNLALIYNGMLLWAIIFVALFVWVYIMVSKFAS